MSRQKAVIMWKDFPQVEITWEPEVCNSEHITPLTDNLSRKIPIKLCNSNGTFKDFLDFLESRCAPRTRYNIEDILKMYDIKFYDPLAMCRKSHGRTMSDYLWVKFNDEEVTWDQIKLRP